jgi:hypothetical protein
MRVGVRLGPAAASRATIRKDASVASSIVESAREIADAVSLIVVLPRLCGEQENHDYQSEFGSGTARIVLQKSLRNGFLRDQSERYCRWG